MYFAVFIFILLDYLLVDVFSALLLPLFPIQALTISSNCNNTKRPFLFSTELGNIKWSYFSPRADLAAAEATRGSTTEARKATVLMTGFPAWLKGTGW